jgi:hypothetical protein
MLELFENAMVGDQIASKYFQRDCLSARDFLAFIYECQRTVIDKANNVVTARKAPFRQLLSTEDRVARPCQFIAIDRAFFVIKRITLPAICTVEASRTDCGIDAKSSSFRA